MFTDGLMGLHDVSDDIYGILIVEMVASLRTEPRHVLLVYHLTRVKMQ